MLLFVVSGLFDHPTYFLTFMMVSRFAVAAYARLRVTSILPRDIFE
jgi:hypothetical protein